MRDLAGLDPRVTVVLLRRNFGQTAALQHWPPDLHIVLAIMSLRWTAICSTPRPRYHRF